MSVAVIAQTLPEIDALKEQRQQEQLEALRRQQEHEPDVRLESDKPVHSNVIRFDEKPCFVIEHISLVGDDSSKFQFAIKETLHKHPDLLGKCLGINAINQLQAELQNSVISKGFITTRVLIEPQDLNSGDLVYSLIPGRISAVAPDNSVSKSTLWFALPSGEGDLLNVRDLEQAMENMKRIPTVDTNIDIKPDDTRNAQPGDSELIFDYQQSKPFRMTLSFDDSGYESTGRYQGSATLSLDNVLGLNDLIYLSKNKDFGGKDNVGGSHGETAHISIPFGYWLLAFTNSEYEYDQRVAGLNQVYVYQGKSERQQLALSRVLYRDQLSKLTFSLTGYHRRSQNFIDDTEIEVQRRKSAGWIAGVDYRRYLGTATIDAGVSYQRGTGAFQAIAAPEEAFGEGTSRPKIINTYINWLMPVQLRDYQIQLRSEWQAQWNKTPLVPQDRFSIAGRYTVRGFDGEQSLSAERGWLSRNTISFPLPGQQQLYSGVDVGHVSGPSAKFLLGQTLAGAVVGFRGQWKGLFYDVFAGKSLSKPDGFMDGRHLGFNLSYQY
ncbi:ShlB/FhaC/HecB family hemolysin secretion/activation protein [Methylophaga sulfidovorans]|uniref:ShlB/FhaC/HecB family hemolysin secretion/activation protein n=1 Tax=Methylophaga sulfidovorans TaxID=45496 RepID=UPI0015A6573E|nr:ShlB/FhaC/HecB family hemolysin secretion/activation protein [Methylophaga sulfidovorans]